MRARRRPPHPRPGRGLEVRPALRPMNRLLRPKTRTFRQKARSLLPTSWCPKALLMSSNPVWSGRVASGPAARDRPSSGRTRLNSVMTSEGCSLSQGLHRSSPRKTPSDLLNCHSPRRPMTRIPATSPHTPQHSTAALALPQESSTNLAAGGRGAACSCRLHSTGDEDRTLTPVKAERPDHETTPEYG